MGGSILDLFWNNNALLVSNQSVRFPSVRWVLPIVCAWTVLISVSAQSPAQAPSPPAAPPIVYQQVPFSPAIQRQMTAAQLGLLEKLNRMDLVHLARATTVIAPDRWTAGELDYSPLPRVWTGGDPEEKLIVVHQPSQVFGAYEAGHLVRWGPISSGREVTQTPAGFYHLTWRSKSRRSSDNREWILNWYFNFVNERGVSFHEFELPGRPASHACVRLLNRDAKWIYDWGES